MNKAEKARMEKLEQENTFLRESIQELKELIVGSNKGKRTDAPKELVNFTKADGTVVQCTAAQAAAWSKWREGAPERKAHFEQMKATWADKKASYKPSKALEDAIRKDRASITHKVAKEQFGFVGTKQDLKALKERICK